MSTTKKKINSRQKGARGERELAALLREHGYSNARRGQQYSGGNDSADVVGLEGFHIENKVVEALNIHKAIKQAVKDSQGTKNVPIVTHKKNREGWLVTLRFEDFMELVDKVLQSEI